MLPDGRRVCTAGKTSRLALRLGVRLLGGDMGGAPSPSRTRPEEAAMDERALFGVVGVVEVKEPGMNGAQGWSLSGD